MTRFIQRELSKFIGLCILLGTTPTLAQVGGILPPSEQLKRAPAVAALGRAKECAILIASEQVQQMLGLLPKRRRPRDPTHGILVSSKDGTRFTIKSGYGTPGTHPATGKDLPSGSDLPPLPYLDRYRRSHVETHSVAIMTVLEITEATLYINNPPCERPYPIKKNIKKDICVWLGCLFNLEKWLPAGYTLTVFVKDVARGIPFTGTR